jgi:hypothetical protein
MFPCRPPHQFDANFALKSINIPIPSFAAWATLGSPSFIAIRTAKFLFTAIHTLQYQVVLEPA